MREREGKGESLEHKTSNSPRVRPCKVFCRRILITSGGEERCHGTGGLNEKKAKKKQIERRGVTKTTRMLLPHHSCEDEQTRRRREKLDVRARRTKCHRTKSVYQPKDE